MLALIGLMAGGYHLDHPAGIAGHDFRSGSWIPQESASGTSSANWLGVALTYLRLWIAIGGVALVIAVIRHLGEPRRLLGGVWLAGLSVAAWAICDDLALHWISLSGTELGEPFSMTAYATKLAMLAVAALSPAAALHYYTNCDLLEKYTLRNILTPLSFCFCAFTTLWLIMDLLDNLKDFQDASASAAGIASFYLSVLPFIYVTVMPASLLLAVLYGLSRLSQSNEITAMLGTGRSLYEVLRPIIALAAMLSAVATAANYHWAPRSEGNKQAVISGLNQKQKDSIRHHSLLHASEDGKRLWYIATLPFSLQNDALRGVHLRIRTSNAQWTRAIQAEAATWKAANGWTFLRGREVVFDNGAPESERPFDVLHISDLPDTPWSLAGNLLVGDSMGVPELASNLGSLRGERSARAATLSAHLHHRFALPWQSFALILAAAPLSISFSRKAATSGLGKALLLFFALLFLNNLCLSLCKGGHLPGWLGNWLPHLLLGVLGIHLLLKQGGRSDWQSIFRTRQPSPALSQAPSSTQAP